MKEITFKCNKRGTKRAYYFSRFQFRWFPMPCEKAELEIATGVARFVPLTEVCYKPGFVRGW